MPPSTGPSARLAPKVPPHTPIARARSLGSSKTLRTIESATGLSIAPPSAWNARAAISTPRLGATAHSADPTTNVIRPVWNTRLRPLGWAAERPAHRGVAGGGGGDWV